MTDSEKIPSLKENGQIKWHNYNYPPLLKLVHFVPSQVPQQKKFIIFALFGIHLATLLTCLLNFIDNCIEGGLGILYSLLFMLIFNPIIFFIFYRAYTGICKNASNLKMYMIIQPIIIVLEIAISIIDFLGFNGFVRVSNQFKAGHGGAATLGLIVSILFLGMGGLSIFIYIKIFRQKSVLTASLL